MEILVAISVVTLLAACSSAKVVGITDGDTLTVMQNKIPIKVRISAIDAPEKAQPYGEQAKQELSELCFKKSVKLVYVDTDKYRRTVADVYCNGVNAGAAMVERGYAWLCVGLREVYRK